MALRDLACFFSSVENHVFLQHIVVTKGQFSRIEYMQPAQRHCFKE